MPEKPERMFPVLYGYSLEESRRKASVDWPKEVPWSLLAPHEQQALRNHEQTLERLAERGGLGLCEMVAVLEDRVWRQMDQVAARDRIVELARAHAGLRARR